MARLPRLTRRPPARQYGNPNALTRDALAASGVDSRALKSLTAAGFRITHEDSDNLRRLIAPWQARSFFFYDNLGEIKYASQFYSRMLSPLRLYAAELDDNGDWVETTNEIAIATLDRIQDPGGGREDLLSSYGRLMFLVGECYLLCSIDADTNLEQWEMLSTDELRIQAGIYTRYRAPSLQAEQLQEPSDDDFEPISDTSAIAYRLWRRHPRFSMMADSTMMGVLDLCDELLTLARAVRARARSRLAGSGILAISESFSYSPPEASPDEDVQSDPFLADLTAAMMLPIANEGTASAVVPLVVRGPTEAVKDGIRHIPIIDQAQFYPEEGLRTECIHRIAIGLDMPPEELEGKADANHWTVWNIDEQTWKAHGMPIANQLVNDLTAAYFRPTIRASGVSDFTRYAIRYDASAVINHPDRTKDAKDLYDRRAIGKEALRDAGGFNEDDAPSDTELAEMIGIAVRDSSLAWDGIPSVKAGGIEPSPGEIIQAGTETGTPSAPTSGGDVEPGPPEEPTDRSDPVSVVGSTERLVARVTGAADVCVLRAREASGNRLRSLAKRDPEIAKAIDGVPIRNIAAVLGPDRVRALGVTERELVAVATNLIADLLVTWGVRDEAAANLIADQIEKYAARTLYEETPGPLPRQFHSYVAGVVNARK